MARIFFDAQAHVVAVFVNPWSDDLPAPVGASGALAYDDSTNPTLADAVLNAMGSYTVVGGVLQKNGSPVTINADSPTKQAIDALLSGAQQAFTNNQAFLALGAPTQQQALAQVQALTRQTNQIIKRLVLLGRAVTA